jgi:hypothetical protein
MYADGAGGCFGDHIDAVCVQQRTQRAVQQLRTPELQPPSGSREPADFDRQICKGTYTEQVQIEKGVAISGKPGAVLKLPAAPADSTTPCDTAIGEPFQPNQDELSICTPGVVSISGLKIEALWPAGFCYDSMYGVFIAGGATLKATSDIIDGAGASPIDGCQGGVALQAGSARTEPNEIGHAVLDKVSISGYQKNGINITGAGATGAITSTTVTGAGPTNQIAQNGIEVAFGGVAKVKGGTISGNECEETPACGFTATQSAGILFFLDGPGSSVTKAKINETTSGPPTSPKAPPRRLRPKSALPRTPSPATATRG